MIVSRKRVGASIFTKIDIFHDGWKNYGHWRQIGFCQVINRTGDVILIIYVKKFE